MSIVRPQLPPFGLALAITASIIGATAAIPSRNRPLAVPVSYDIELEFRGISGHHARSAAECTAPVSDTGFDRLVGTVSADEINVNDEDITYTGTLTRTTAMDFCDLTGPPGQEFDCDEHLVADGAVDVEIEVYGEPDRGAWMKAKVTKVNSATVTGQCGPAVAADIQAEYGGRPMGAGGGGSPDGQPIEDKWSQPTKALKRGPGPLFYQNNRARLRVGYFPPDPAAGGWVLWVKRQIP